MNDTLFSDTACAPPLEGVHDDSFESGFYTYSGTDVPNKSTPKHHNKVPVSYVLVHCQKFIPPMYCRSEFCSIFDLKV